MTKSPLALRREVKSLAQGLTTDRASIQLTIPTETTVEVVFVRKPGRQVDVVDPMFKTYRYYLSIHAEITVYFETAKKRF